MQSNALQQLQEIEKSLVDELQKVRAAIKLFIGNGSVPDIYESTSKTNNIESSVQLQGYSSKWTYSKKFIFFLKKEDRFMHVRQIAENIANVEGGDIKRILNKLSSATFLIKKEGVIVKYQINNQNQNTFWGFPKWLDENGEIKKGHEYSEDYLYSPKSKEDLFDFK
jgi:hypothetical protein